MTNPPSSRSLNAWLSFLTEPLPAADSATSEALRETAADVIVRRLTDAARRGLLDEGVVLAQFVQVLPENRRLDFDVPTIMARERRDELLRAVVHLLSYVKATGVSIFSRLLFRPRHDELGDVLVMSPEKPAALAGHRSDRYTIHCVRTPPPAPLLTRLPPVDQLRLKIDELEGTRYVACGEIEQLIRELPAEPVLGTATETAPPELVDLLGDAAAAAQYLRNLAPLAVDGTGHIVLIVPRVHSGGRAITERLGGGGCIFVMMGTLTPELIDLLYAMTFRLSAAVVDLCSVARALDQGLVYERALQVFGHDVGRLFQESSLLSLVAHPEPRVRLAVRRLSVAWGIAEATRVLKQQDGLPRNWLTHEHVGPPDDETLTQALRDVCSFYLFASDTLPERVGVEWRLPGDVVHRETMAAGRDRELSTVDVERLATGNLPHLPGLKDHRATSALTFGLAELLRNARKSVTDNEHALREACRRNQLHDPCLGIEIAFDKSKGTVSVHIESLHLGGTSIWSRTIAGIQGFERACLGRGKRAVVSTGQFKSIDPASADIDRIRATWTYDYTYVATLAQENG